MAKTLTGPRTPIDTGQTSLSAAPRALPAEGGDGAVAPLTVPTPRDPGFWTRPGPASIRARAHHDALVEIALSDILTKEEADQYYAVKGDGPTDIYTMNESDARFVNAAGDTVTGALLASPDGGVALGGAGARWGPVYARLADLEGAFAGATVLTAGVTGGAAPGLTVRADGSLLWGDPFLAGPADMILTRTGPGYLAVGPVANPLPLALSTTANNGLVWDTTGLWAPAGLTVTEADATYQKLADKGAPSGYAPLDPNSKVPTANLPPIAITDTFTAANEPQMLALTAQVGDVCIRTDESVTYILVTEPANVLANWTQLASGVGVTSVDGKTGVVSLAADYVNVAGDAMTGALSVQGKAVAVSASAGNQITWNADGFFNGLANVSVMTRQEFTPANGATTVTLGAAPTALYQVARNGVEQSQALGHYSLAGAVVTFSDAFGTGEQVIVLYGTGTSVAVGGYVAKAGDTMTGDLARNGADLTDRLLKWQTNGADRWRLGIIDTQAEGTPDVGGDLKLQAVWNSGTAQDVMLLDRDLAAVTFRTAYNGVTFMADGASYPIFVRHRTDTQPAFRISEDGEFSWGSGAAATDTIFGRSSANLLYTNATIQPQTTNTRDLGTASFRWRKLWATDADINTGLTFANDATAKLSRPSAGALRVDTNLGVGVNPAAWLTGWAGLQVGQAGSVFSDTAGVQLLLGSNTYVGAGGTNNAIVTGPASRLQFYNGELLVTNSGSVAAGATQTMTQRLRMNGSGTLTLSPDAGQAAISAGANHLALSVPAGYAVMPITNNTGWLGNSANKWEGVYATLGTINTSLAEAKEAITPLDPAACARAVLDTDWVDFTYKPPLLTEGGDAETHARMVEETAFTRRQRGYVLGSPDHRVSDLFGLSDRQSASPQSDLGVVACALGQALRDLADARARIAALEAAR
jgi:hypothetical protein